MDFEVEINLKPEDVLVHLEQLGYHDISPLQLKEFIRDLKKLIKYDIKKQKENEASSSIDTTKSISSTPSSNSSCSMEQGDRKRKPLSQTNKQSRWRINSSGSTATSSSSYSVVAVLLWKKKGLKRKPHREKQDLLFWKTFKLPGEDDHRELRWNIRERMLGPSQSSARSTRSTPRSSCSTLNRL
ncbi:hypothetical protein B566_EDAN008868 [Ephemera danica]|nr:hypothetical protein B566_EDAN008868 [Ephemera danica]